MALLGQAAMLLSFDVASEVIPEHDHCMTRDVDWALFITGYGQDAVAGLTQPDLGTGSLETRGATGVVDAMYRMDYALTDREVGA